MFDGNQWGMFQTILLLFIVLDPFGNMVLINSLLDGVRGYLQAF